MIEEKQWTSYTWTSVMPLTRFSTKACSKTGGLRSEYTGDGLVADWLMERKQKVKIKGEYSQVGSADSGLPQGTVLGHGFYVFIKH